jgi:hypothetical protein
MIQEDLTVLLHGGGVRVENQRMTLALRGAGTRLVRGGGKLLQSCCMRPRQALYRHHSSSELSQLLLGGCVSPRLRGTWGGLQQLQASIHPLAPGLEALHCGSEALDRPREVVMVLLRPGHALRQRHPRRRGGLSRARTSDLRRHHPGPPSGGTGRGPAPSRGTSGGETQNITPPNGGGLGLPASLAPGWGALVSHLVSHAEQDGLRNTEAGAGGSRASWIKGGHEPPPDPGNPAWSTTG